MSDASEQTAPKASSKLPLLVVIIAVLGGAGGWYVMSTQQYRMVEREGTVTFIDYANRDGELELPDPKGGTPMTVGGEFAEDCTFTIDGKPAKLAEIQVGDRVFVKAKLERRKTANGGKESHFTALAVNVLKEGS